MACRSLERCAAAKAELDARPGLPGSCECRHLDLGSYASIRAFAAGLHEGGARPIAALVNNAGVMGDVPGIMQPNHFGPYLLTRLLLPLMAAGGRVVNVASEAHRRGSLRVPRLPSGQRQVEGGQPGGWYAAYAQVGAPAAFGTAGVAFCRALLGRQRAAGRKTVCLPASHPPPQPTPRTCPL